MSAVLTASGGPETSGLLEAINAIPFKWAKQITFDPSDSQEIVEDVLVAGGMSVWYGESNSGKTTLVLDLCLRMPSGESWLGKRLPAGAVIYVAAESPASVYKRIEAHRRHCGRNVDDLGVISCSLNLLDPSSDTDVLIELIKLKRFVLRRSIHLIVIDTLSRSMPGANENAVEDMTRLIYAADRIRAETGAHVAFIHHCGKDTAKGARGHSSLRAACDTEIEVQDDGNRVHSLTITKQRDLDSKGLKLSARFVPVELGHNQWGKPITACVVEPVEQASAHLQALLQDTEDRRAEEVTVAGFGQLFAMGIKPTDGNSSPDYLPKQLLAKRLSQGFSKDQLEAAMHRLMADGKLNRSVIGQYSNRNPRFGLSLSDVSNA